jgi:glutamate-1-semialdehyde 2,1-aminomutase
MPKVVAIIIARMGSTRLPGKVLMPLGYSRVVLDWVADGSCQTTGIDETWVATSTDPRDDAIESWCKDAGLPFHRGSETDVLARVYECAVKASADYIVRITGDCPFLDSNVIAELIALRHKTHADYASNVNPPTYPDGLDAEVFSMEALTAAHHEATRESDRDTVTQYIVRNGLRWHSQTLVCPIPGLHRERWVLDTQEDYEFCCQLWERLPDAWNYLSILKILDQEPDLRLINARHKRNERFFGSLADELDAGPRNYQNSRKLLARACTVMPYGAGTYSKSHVAWGTTNGPLYLDRGQAGRVFDVDGNDYVDCIGALLPVILGYCDPDVDEAVRTQQCKGVSFSLGTKIEIDLAEQFCDFVPSAEQVFFCKNGSDALSGAVRLARLITGESHVQIFEGAYHGWHDWALWGDPIRGNGTTPQHVWRLKPGEMPKAKTAAIIVEPDAHAREDLQYLRTWCLSNNALLIFDENVTGMRWPSGSAQASYNIQPDLSCFGKSIANGYPLAALCGKREFMQRIAPHPKHIDPNIFFSGTFWGDTLGMAAAQATIEKCRARKVWFELEMLASELMTATAKSAKARVVEHLFSMGPPPLYRFTWSNPKLAAAFRHHMAQAGVLIYSSFNLCLAHTGSDIMRVCLALDYAFERIAAGDTNYHAPSTGIMRR